MDFVPHEEGKYTVFCDGDGIEIFRYDHEMAADFRQSREKLERGIDLCLRARIIGNWKGDILNPMTYKA